MALSKIFRAGECQHSLGDVNLEDGARALPPVNARLRPGGEVVVLGGNT